MSTFWHRGFNIEVARDGKFKAQIDDLEVTADTLAEAKTKIDAATLEAKEKKPIALRIVGLLGRVRDGADAAKVHVATLTGINRSTRAFQFAAGDVPKGHEFDSDSILADTAANRAALADMVEKRRAAEIADDRVQRARIESAGYGRITTIEQYQRMIEAVKQYHAKSAKVK